MTFQRLIRRLHLYLGAFLVPWFLMFGFSSFVLNHPLWFGAGEGANAAAQWTTLFDRPYALEVAQDVDLRAVGAKILADNGLRANVGYGVGRPSPARINVNLPSFARPIRVSYFVADRRVLAEQRTFSTWQSLSSMHTRDGYYLRNGWQTAWAVTVDALCVALVFWVASGLYMWWLLPATRTWGWLAVAGGMASFATLMLTL